MLIVMAVVMVMAVSSELEVYVKLEGVLCRCREPASTVTGGSRVAWLFCS